MPEINPKLCKKSAFPRKPVFKWYHTSAFFNFVSSQHLLLKYNSTYGSIILESNVKKRLKKLLQGLLSCSWGTIAILCSHTAPLEKECEVLVG